MWIQRRRQLGKDIITFRIRSYCLSLWFDEEIYTTKNTKVEKEKVVDLVDPVDQVDR